MGRHSKPDLPGDVRSGGLTDTGSHRAVGTEAPPRGIAKWPFVVLAVVAVLGLGVLAVVWGQNALGNADAEENQCSEGRRTLRITAAPKLVEPLNVVADRWNATPRDVHSHCITVEVTGSREDEALQAISQTDGVLAVPAVWIAESSNAGERLTESNPRRVAKVSRPLKSSTGFILPYIVIAGRGVDDVQQRAALEFRDFLDGADQQKILAESGFGA